MTVAAVVFDIGGVLERVDDAAWPELFVRRWEARAGLAAGSLLERLAEHEPSGSMVTGEVTEAQMRAGYQRALGIDDAATEQMMAELWDAYCGELDEAMFAFAASLRPTYRTAILSNSADGARREEQRRYGFEQLVDTIVYSHEVGVAKPDELVYRLTEERLGVAGHQIVFVDDVADNIDAARRHGWHGVWHRGETEATIRAVQTLLDAHH
jgi:putative hydrolase of the HAD superfamily